MVAYVALIPLFAIGYCLLRGQHFYAPYARMEKPAIADAIRISGYIRDAIAKSYRGHESNGDGWQIAMSDIEVSNLATDRSNGLDFTVSFFATKHEGGEIVQSTGGPQFEAHLSQQKIVVQQRPGWLVCHIVSFPSEPDQGGPTEFNRHLLFRPLAASLQADAICLGGQEENALMNLLSGWSGDPRSLSGFPWRMLYFSATTITTVGFGDIVPLSGEARLLTAIEAIAGWLVAGLFLNALAARLAQRGANSM
ncbi:MAG: potassium channel family protein [Rhizomicrobium sp.]